MRKFYKVITTDGPCFKLAHSADDAMSRFSDAVSARPATVKNTAGVYEITRLSELPDGAKFYKALPALGYCGSVPFTKGETENYKCVCYGPDQEISLSIDKDVAIIVQMEVQL